MTPPPVTLDGAAVLFWAWSENVPFFTMSDGNQGIPIFGLAVCRYSDAGSVYRFSCNKNWEVENDSHWGDSVEHALLSASGDYDIAAIKWMVYDVVGSSPSIPIHGSNTRQP